ncbi:MAG: hypothetical protein ACO3D2_05250, partial [Holophagaceae bacterium]
KACDGSNHPGVRIPFSPPTLSSVQYLSEFLIDSRLSLHVIFSLYKLALREIINSLYDLAKPNYK